MAALCCCWVVATPLGAAPDEPTQFVRAASVGRGQFLGTRIAGKPDAYTLVKVPRTYTFDVPCTAFKPEVTAACQTLRPPSARIVPHATYVGRYPPLYYLLVGWPSLLTSRYVGFYLMRVVGALINSALLAAAVAAARRWSSSPLLGAGLAVAIAPEALYLASVMNPNGLEISAAIAAWTAAVIWTGDHYRRPPPGLVVLLGTSVVVCASTRPISLLWPAFILVCLLPAAWGRLRPIELLRKRRDVLGWTSASLAAAVADLLWVVRAHSLALPDVSGRLPNDSLGYILRAAVGREGRLFQMGVDVLGWFDVTALWGVDQIWYVTGATLVILGFMWLRGRDLASVVAVVSASLLFPIVITVATAAKMGLDLQGRYLLPLWVGVPILAAGLVRPRLAGAAPTFRLRIAVVGLVAIGQFVTFFWALHRYVMGADGPLFTTAHVAHPWHPPLPWPFLDLVFAVLCVAVAHLMVGPREADRVAGEGPAIATVGEP
jgi:hypothetical protein